MHASARRHAIRTKPRAARTALGAAIAALLVLPAAARAEHAPSQDPGPTGCISEGGSPDCTDADLLTGAFSVALSNDGRHAYVALADGRGVAALARDRRTGALAQLPSPTGCTSQTGTGGLCATGRGLHVPIAAAVSPDGRHVYVVSQQRDPVTLSALALFARDASTGALTQLAGLAGCISGDLPGECTPGIGLGSAASVAISPDGRSVYVASASDAVAVFARDAATGALTQLAEPYGCVSQSGSGGQCTQGKALDGARAVAVSRDGEFVYVGSELSRAVAVFSRDRRTGALTQLPGEDGCIADNGSIETCTDGVGLGGPVAVTISPNGRNVYVASSVSHEVAALARDRKSGTLRPMHCTRNDVSVVCEAGVALRQPFSVTVGRDGKRVYVAARDSDAVAVFGRDRKTGWLTQLASPAGCISDDGSEGLCTDGRALRDPRSVAVSRDGRHLYVAAQGSAAVAVLKTGR
ncbi:MAG: beta-propeller fold lactonase family protein [Thermodesulfobacteriota bacterium]